MTGHEHVIECVVWLPLAAAEAVLKSPDFSDRLPPVSSTGNISVIPLSEDLSSMMVFEKVDTCAVRPRVHMVILCL